MSNFENRVIELMTKDRLTIEQATKKAVDEQTRSRMEAHSVIDDTDNLLMELGVKCIGCEE